MSLSLTYGPKISVATVTITYLILALLVAIVVFAHPTIRTKYHNSFESVHRFLGWTATALVWSQVRSFSSTRDAKI